MLDGPAGHVANHGLAEILDSPGKAIAGKRHSIISDGVHVLGNNEEDSNHFPQVRRIQECFVYAPDAIPAMLLSR